MEKGRRCGCWLQLQNAVPHRPSPTPHEGESCHSVTVVTTNPTVQAPALSTKSTSSGRCCVRRACKQQNKKRLQKLGILCGRGLPPSLSQKQCENQKMVSKN